MPTTMGAANATHAAQCQIPVLTSAMINANRVSAARINGVRQTNQNLLRDVVCVDTKIVFGKIDETL